MRWKIGELAAVTGLTVRTLRHYDDVGLLVPSQRTPAGHRVYDAHDARRLYRILALRRLGFRLDEIASVLDDGGAGLLETVRRHLEQVERDLEHQHRLRERLRRILDALQRSAQPPVSDYLDAMGAMTMIKIEVRDVVMRVPVDEADEPAPATAREALRQVWLQEREGDRALPIWIGAAEGDALVYARSRHDLPRPMGPDLTAKLLQAAGVGVRRVVIEGLRGNTFLATVVIAAGGEAHEVDARPSDALNLAVRLGVPVFVAPELMDQGAIDFDKVPWLATTTGAGERGATSGEWRSVTPELIASLQPRMNTKLLDRVVSWAREEAREVGHDEIRPAHLLVALLRDPDDRTRRVLDVLGVTIEVVRTRLRAEARGRKGSGDEIPLSAESQKVLKLAELDASLGSYQVTAQHILLGLVHENALLEYGVTPSLLGEKLFGATTTEAPGGD